MADSPSAADPAAEILTEARELLQPAMNGNPLARIQLCLTYAPLLVAALGKALERHQPKSRKVTRLCGIHPSANLGVAWVREAITACPDCTVTDTLVCKSCRYECPDGDRWPCEEYEEITRELTAPAARLLSARQRRHLRVSEPGAVPDLTAARSPASL